MQVKEQFAMQSPDLSSAPIDRVIAKYFSASKSSSLKRKLGADAPTVLNLCVAYKLLLHRKLVEKCYSS